ncbi:hypothetical protein ONZ43_g7409 [Nemania bipapillata]|uniref:Uncharacterized protein n=1 Tax=Nemania bipapillata TaxID=110536 RepID=A0ACC2HRK8_9PEZI|nr:hypothetical protein ONZ43_g7409 [Nemania bipapillata]
MASLDLLDPRLRSPKVTTTSSSHAGGQLQGDDESEWEYEYSTTETETFYVTLDLSKADFRAQEQVKNNSFPSRGGWQTHRASELFLNRRKARDRASHNSAASSAASSDAEQDDEDRAEISQNGQGKRRSSAQEDDGTNNERVQILELHSENPIISYKGRVFSGQWSENTTTELLFTRHDEKNPLPVLRHLNDGVDLLAASSARINVTEQILKPKFSDRERQRASANLPQTIIPPVDLKSSQERIDQRNFLADLIAIKRRKGETDDVTVIARSMQGKRAKAKAKGVRTNRRGRWTHADKLHPVRGLEERSRRGGRRKGSGRARGKWALFPLEEPARDSASVASSVHSPAEGESCISTPTPFRWDDLEEGQDGSPAPLEELIEADMDDEQDGDDVDVEYDENNDYDEDEEDDQEEMDEDED